MSQTERKPWKDRGAGRKKARERINTLQFSENWKILWFIQEFKELSILHLPNPKWSCVFSSQLILQFSLFYHYHANRWYLLPVINWATTKKKMVHKLTFTIPFHPLRAIEFSNQKSSFLLKIHSLFCWFCPLSFVPFVIYLPFLLSCLSYLSLLVFPFHCYHFLVAFSNCPAHPPSTHHVSALQSFIVIFQS